SLSHTFLDREEKELPLSRGGRQQLLTIQQAMDVYQLNAMTGPCVILPPCEEKIPAMRLPCLQRRCASRFFV
ncbi:hypothetical protein, partial [uncultured Bilophila sp.]|uniref:hypothetical protein n=1 Tax=uncultured Bilophila sp. TaxID=529385 RepID=UPI00280B07BB